MTHIDEWADGRESDDYAAWMFSHFRLPALLRCRFDKFMEGCRLFCTHEKVRWRVTGASRLGDVWLARDFGRDTGYDRRVDVTTCSGWSATPEPPPEGK